MFISGYQHTEKPQSPVSYLWLTLSSNLNSLAYSRTVVLCQPTRGMETLTMTVIFKPIKNHMSKLQIVRTPPAA